MSSFSETQDEFYSSMTFTGLSTNIYYRFLVQGINDVGYCVPFAFTSTLGFGISAGGAFSPSSLTDMALWLDAASSNNFTLSGSNIITWIDRSPNAYTATKYGSSNLLLSTSAVHFTNTSYLAIPDALPLRLQTSSFSVFSVYRTVLTNQTQFLLSKFQESGIYDGWNLRAAEFGNGSVRPAWYSSGNSDIILTSSITVDGTFKMITAYKNLNTINGYLNGLLEKTSTVTSPASWTGQLNIGVRQSNQSDPFYGSVQEIIMFSNAITPFDRQKVEGYLGWKWGLQSNLPVSHPFRAAAPTATSVFSPSSFGGMALWLDAADPTTVIRTQSTVTQWNDKSGLARNFTTTSTDIKYYVSSPVNSQPALNFSNAAGMSNTFAFSSSNQLSFFIVCNHTSNAATSGNSEIFANAQDYRGFDLFSHSSSDSNIKLNLGTATLATSGSNILGTNAVISIVSTSNAGSLGINGSTLATFTPGQTAPLSSSYRYNICESRYIGNICEILAYSNVLSTDDRQTVEGYLAWKWGLQGNLPATHPYKFLSPASNYAGDVVPQNLLVRFDAATYSGSGAWANTGALGSLANASNNAGSPTKNGAGNGIVFNSANTWICPPTGTVSFGTFTSYTFSTWYKRMGAIDTNDSVVQAFVGGGGGTAFYMSRRDPQYDNNTELRLNTYDGGSVIIQGTNYSFPLNTWVQFTVTHNGSSLTTYVNGSAIGTVAATAVPAMGGGFYIGYNGSSGILNSSEIGQILIYNRVLTAAEVAQNYAATSSTFSV
jgi:hypothetical protein